VRWEMNFVDGWYDEWMVEMVRSYGNGEKNV
jgi:hypothetical protein